MLILGFEELLGTNSISCHEPYRDWSYSLDSSHKQYQSKEKGEGKIQMDVE